MKTISFALIFITISLGIANGQSDIIITLGMPSFMQSVVDDSVFEEFYNQFPDVTVHVKVIDWSDLPMHPDGYYDPLITGEAYVHSADVLIVQSDPRFSPAIDYQQTLAGYFLDLSPLVATDPSYNIDDLYPAVQDVFHWGGGMWALPIFFNASIIAYDPAAFDAAGLSYPTEEWSLTELIAASSILSEYDSEGKIVHPGFVNAHSNPSDLILSLLGEGLVDVSTSTPELRIHHDQLRDLLNEWANSEELTMSYTADALPQFPPIIFDQLGIVLDHESRYDPAPLPGGRSSVYATGVAVSKGTLWPELAYELAKYVTNQPILVNKFNDVIPARTGEQSTIINPLSQINEAKQNTIHVILSNALPARDIQFRSSLNVAMLDILFNPTITADEALHQLEQNILTTLEQANTTRTSTSIVVDPPPRDDVEWIKFGVVTRKPPNQFEWDRLIEMYVDTNPAIEDVFYEMLDTGLQNKIINLSEDYDCFYAEGLRLREEDKSYLYETQSLLSIDDELDMNNFVGNILSLQGQNDKNWGIPISVDPMVIAVDEEALNRQNITLPDEGWTVTEFESLLSIIDVEPSGRPILQVLEYPDDFLMSLISAHSGPPIDYRSDPPALNFADPATMQAIQDVLELVRAGFIEYSLTPQRLDDGVDPPVMVVGTYSYLTQSDRYTIVPIPPGDVAQLLTARVGYAYISKQARFVDECYDLIKLLMLNAEQLDLFSAYDPRSTYNDELYARFDHIWNEKELIFVASPDNPTNQTAHQLISYWLSREFDLYIESGSEDDLKLNLTELKVELDQFQNCIASIDLSGEENKIIEAFIDCVHQVDPELANHYSELFNSV